MVRWKETQGYEPHSIYASKDLAIKVKTWLEENFPKTFCIIDPYDLREEL